MSTLLLTERPDGGLVTCRQTPASTRLVARLRTWSLDTALANGASPDSNAGLSLRARVLIAQRTRLKLSREIHRLQRDAERVPHPLNAGAPLCRRKIAEARPAFDNLTRQLVGPRPVDAVGVARVKLLLRDGSSPLYRAPAADDLRDALDEATEALEVRLPSMSSG